MPNSLSFGSLALLLAAGLTGCGEPIHSCLPNQIRIAVPAGCGAKVTKVTASGTACPHAEPERDQDEFTVRPTEEGTCDLRVEFEDGLSYDYSATVRRVEGCSNAPYPIHEHNFIEVPYPGTCD